MRGMSIAPVTYKSDTGQELTVTAEDVRNVISTSPNVTDKEVSMFLALCKAQRLNPFVKDAYLVKYGSSPATIITGKEAFTKRANAAKGYQGYEAGVVYADRNGAVCRREGSSIYRKAGETLLGGWCRVFVEGRKPFFDEVSIDEYSTGKSGWAKMPGTMIRKVALCHALREAFPESLQGLYQAEEMGSAAQPEIETQEAPQQPQQSQYDAQAVRDAWARVASLKEQAVNEGIDPSELGEWAKSSIGADMRAYRADQVHAFADHIGQAIEDAVSASMREAMAVEAPPADNVPLINLCAFEEVEAAPSDIEF